MKKIILSALCMLGLAVGAYAQDSFRKGTNSINLGVGVSNYPSVVVPALSFTYDYSMADKIFDYGSIGLGGQAEFEGYGVEGQRWSRLFVGARGTFRYEFVDRLDTYVGVQAGLFHNSGFGASLSRTRFGFSGVLGARYFFNNTVALFGELGTGISVFKVGLGFNL